MGGRKVDLDQVVIPASFIHVDGGRTDTYTPDGSFTRPYKTFQAATSDNHKLIFVNPGTYTGTDVVFGNGDIIVRGVGRDSVKLEFSITTGTGTFTGEGFEMGPATVPDPEDVSVILDVSLSSTGCFLSGIRFSYSRVSVASDAIIQNCVFKHNTDNGGSEEPCIYTNTGNVLINSCVFSKDNSSGAIWQLGGTTYLRGCLISGNSSGYMVTSAGGVLVVSDCSISSSDVTPQSIAVNANGALQTSPNIIENSILLGDVQCGASWTKISGLTTASSIVGTNLIYESTNRLKNDSEVTGVTATDALNTLNSGLGSQTIEGLSDVVATLSGNSSKVLIVNVDGTPKVSLTSYTFPFGEGSDGSLGQVLTTNGSGIAYWGATSGVSSFDALDDTPAYSTNGLKGLIVNSGVDGVGVTPFTFPAVNGNPGYVLTTNGSGATSWTNVAGVSDFVNLSDTPGSFTGSANKALVVNTGQSAVTVTPFTFPTADGTINQVLTTNGSGALAWSAQGASSYSGLTDTPLNLLHNNLDEDLTDNVQSMTGLYFNGSSLIVSEAGTHPATDAVDDSDASYWQANHSVDVRLRAWLNSTKVVTGVSIKCIAGQCIQNFSIDAHDNVSTVDGSWNDLTGSLVMQNNGDTQYFFFDNPISYSAYRVKIDDGYTGTITIAELELFEATYDKIVALSPEGDKLVFRDINSDEIVEGTNKFYATSLFDSDLATKDTDDLSEGTAKYYATSLFDADLATKTTDDLADSTATNKYYATSLFNTDFGNSSVLDTTDMPASEKIGLSVLGIAQPVYDYSTAVGGSEDNATDQDNGTSWLASLATNQHLRVDLVDDHIITGISIYDSNSNGIDSFEVRASAFEAITPSVTFGPFSKTQDSNAQEFTWTNTTAYRYYEIKVVSTHSGNVQVTELDLLKFSPDILAMDPETGNFEFRSLQNSDLRSVSTTDLTEGANKYYATSLFDTDLATKTTDDLTEGTFKYYATSLFNTDFGNSSVTSLSDTPSSIILSDLILETSYGSDSGPSVFPASNLIDNSLSSDWSIGTYPLDFPGTDYFYDVTFPSTTVCRGMSFRKDGIPSTLAVKDFEVYGEVDPGVSGLVLLGTFIYLDNDTTQYYFFKNETAYKKYRVKILSNYGSDTYIRMTELELFSERGKFLSTDLSSGIVYDSIFTSDIFDFSGGFDTNLALKSTDDLTEGSTNKYYATSLFNADLATKTTDDLDDSTASNKYYATSLFDADFSGKDTGDLAEGTNKYATQTQVDLLLATSAVTKFPDVEVTLSGNTRKPIVVNDAGTGLIEADFSFADGYGLSGEILTSQGNGTTSWSSATGATNFLGLGDTVSSHNEDGVKSSILSITPTIVNVTGLSGTAGGSSANVYDSDSDYWEPALGSGRKYITFGLLSSYKLTGISLQCPVSYEAGDFTFKGNSADVSGAGWDAISPLVTGDYSTGGTVEYFFFDNDTAYQFYRLEFTNNPDLRDIRIEWLGYYENPDGKFVSLEYDTDSASSTLVYRSPSFESLSDVDDDFLISNAKRAVFTGETGTKIEQTPYTIPHYTGTTGKVLRITTTNTADWSSSKFLELDQTPSSFSGNVFKSLRVNSGSGALEFTNTGFGVIREITSATVNVLATDYTVVCDSSNNDIIATLPDPVNNSGQFFIIKKKNGLYSVSIDVSGPGTIDGKSSILLDLDGSSVSVQSDGTEYKIHCQKSPSTNLGRFRSYNAIEYVSSGDEELALESDYIIMTDTSFNGLDANDVARLVLPTTATTSAGHLIIIKKKYNDGKLDIYPEGSALLDGNSSKQINFDDAVELVFDGSNWWTIRFSGTE
jgi:hypothetical protein